MASVSLVASIAGRLSRRLLDRGSQVASLQLSPSSRVTYSYQTEPAATRQLPPERARKLIQICPCESEVMRGKQGRNGLASCGDFAAAGPRPLPDGTASITSGQ